MDIVQRQTDRDAGTGGGGQGGQERQLPHPRPQAQARAALTVALGQAVEQFIVIGSFALKECCGWEGNAG